MSSEDHKSRAAERALGLVKPGMKLGLGTGSTAAKFVELLGARVRGGLQVVGVPTSEATRQQAERVGIPLTSLDREPLLDLTIDGADEIDAELRLIKGGGGALFREKIVAAASARMVVIADASKKVATLGKFPLPIEVGVFGMAATRRHIAMLAEDVGCTGRIVDRVRADGSLFITDGGNAILDCHFGAIEDPEGLAEALKVIPGVIEHGLFIGIADVAIIGGSDGVEVIAIDGEEV